MIIHKVEQGTPEWLQLRLGKPTASELSNIVTSKGEPSGSAGKFALKKAAEIIVNRPIESYSNAAMAHGHETEEEARNLYCFETGQEVEQVGFCTTDDESLGASPDGFVLHSDEYVGGLEIKSPFKPEIHMERLVGPDKLPIGFILQVQGSLLVTEFEWWDFVSYFRDLPVFKVRVMPDLDLHMKIIEQVSIFNDNVAKIVDDVNDKYSLGEV